MSDRTRRAKSPVGFGGRERAKRRGLPSAVTALSATALSSCGLVGSDAYRRPDPCRGGGTPVEHPKRNLTCVFAFSDIILTRDFPPDHPEVQNRLEEAAKTIGSPVAYTDGTTTVTYVPRLSRATITVNAIEEQQGTGS